MNSKEIHHALLIWRGIDPGNECQECGGSGYKAYADTSTYGGGIGGQTITGDRCNHCWGSGDALFPWPDPRKIREEDVEAIEKRSWNAAIDKTAEFARECIFSWDVEDWRNMTKDELIKDTCHKIADSIKEMKK